MAPQPSEDYEKWYRWACEKRHGKESVEGRKESKMPNLTVYEPNIKRYWDEEKAVGVLEFDGKFIGVACLVAKEVTDKESFVRRFGLSFEKDVQWHAVSGLLDHLSRSSM
ncbi:MAG: hypothetical protein ACPL3B_01575, partial [Fervidobacterium sp.]